MWTRQHKPRKTGRLIVPAITASFLSYFGFHAYHGDFGIYSKYRLEARIVELQASLQAVESRRGGIEGRVRLLRDGTIERDMLDEYARRALNVSRADELTVFLSPVADR